MPLMSKDVSARSDAPGDVKNKERKPCRMVCEDRSCRTPGSRPLKVASGLQVSRAALALGLVARMSGSTAFARAVAFLRAQRQTVTTVESSCGGLISSGIMAVPGSSAVYYGGSVSYNTKKARKLLLDDGELHAALVAGVEPREGESEADQYIRSKHDWTARTAVAFCEAMETDYALAEGGAVGPTFAKEGLTSGFTVLCVAGRSAPGEAAKVLAQRLVRSDHAERGRNMQAFAEHAAELLCETIGADEAAPT